MDGERIAIGLACAAAFGGGLWLFLSAFGRLRLRHAVAGTPTAKVRSMAMGKAELKGQARPEGTPLAAAFSGSPCVWFRWLVEEERTETDSKGRTRKAWHSIASGISEAPFRLEDLTGAVMVLPAGAEVDAPKMLSYTSGGFFQSAARPSGPMAAQWLGGGGFLSARRRLSEWRLDLERPIYALGVARPPSSEEALPKLTQGRNGEPFLLSVQSEDELLRSLAWGAAGRMGGGAVLALGGLAFAARAFLNW